MNKYLLLLFGFPWLVQAQNATITGQIANAAGDSVFVSHFDLVQMDEVMEGTALLPDGSFRLDLEVETGPNYYFKHGGERATIRLRHGDSLHLTLDQALFDETLAFSGTSAAINNYIAAHYLRFLDGDDYEQNLTMAYQFKIRKLDPWPYLAWVDSVTAVQLAFLESWKTQLPENEYVHERGRLIYQGVHQKGMYKALRGLFAQQLDHVKVPEYPENLEDFILEVPLNEDAYVKIDDYLTTSHWKLLRLLHASRPGLRTDQPEYPLSYLRLADSLCSPTVAHHLGKYWLTTSLQRSGPDLYEPAVTQYLQSDAPDELKSELQQVYLKAKGFTRGAAAFDFELQDAAGRTVRLSDYAGKFVYLDFWATWCVPCLAQLQYVRQNNIQAPDSNFVFLYISMDEDEAVWRKSMAKYLPNAHHLWGKGMNTTVANAYGLRSLPNYFLIGPDGGFLDTDPTRPSSGQLYEYLREEQRRYHNKQ